MSSVATRLPEPELPPSPPCERAVQRSLQESTEYPPVPMHNSITGPLAIRINEGREEEAHPMAMVSSATIKHHIMELSLFELEGVPRQSSLLATVRSPNFIPGE